MAQTWRDVAGAAERLGMRRPSYQHVRRLVRIERRRRQHGAPLFRTITTARRTPADDDGAHAGGPCHPGRQPRPPLIETGSAGPLEGRAAVLHGGYAQRYNLRHGRRGLVPSRFGCRAIRDDRQPPRDPYVAGTGRRRPGGARRWRGATRYRDRGSSGRTDELNDRAVEILEREQRLVHEAHGLVARGEAVRAPQHGPRAPASIGCTSASTVSPIEPGLQAAQDHERAPLAVRAVDEDLVELRGAGAGVLNARRRCAQPARRSPSRRSPRAG